MNRMREKREKHRMSVGAGAETPDPAARMDGFNTELKQSQVGFTKGQTSATDFVKKVGQSIMGVVTKAGYSAGPTGDALNLWLKIIRERKFFSAENIQEAMRITVNAIKFVLFPFFGDVTKKVTQATVSTALAVAAPAEFAHALTMNQFDLYLYPNMGPLRIADGADMNDLYAALKQRRMAIQPDSDEESAIPVAPTPPEALFKKPLKQAIKENKVEEKLEKMIATNAVPQAPPPPKNLVWKKVAEKIEKAEMQPAVDPMAMVSPVASFDPPKQSAAGASAISVVADLIVSIVSQLLSRAAPKEDPAKVRALVEAQKPYAEKLATGLRNELMTSKPKKAVPAGKGGSLSTLLKIADVGALFGSNLLTSAEFVDVAETMCRTCMAASDGSSKMSGRGERTLTLDMDDDDFEIPPSGYVVRESSSKRAFRLEPPTQAGQPSRADIQTTGRRGATNPPRALRSKCEACAVPRPRYPTGADGDASASPTIKLILKEFNADGSDLVLSRISPTTGTSGIQYKDDADRTFTFFYNYALLRTEWDGMMHNLQQSLGVNGKNWTFTAKVIPRN